MKKLFAVLITALVLTACNSNADSSSKNDADTTKSVTRDGDQLRTDTTGPRVDSGTAK